MRRFERLPVPELRPFVDRLWGWESAPGEVVRLPTLLPGTGAELYFHYGTPFRTSAADGAQRWADRGHLLCIRGAPIELSAAVDVGFVAVRFKIGMLHRFTAIPAGELLDRTSSVSDIWGARGASLLRRLSYSNSRNEMVDHIQSFLVRRLTQVSPDGLVERAMQLAYRHGAALSVRALANELDLGRRQFERRWKAFSGQSPSDVRMLSRFQHTVRRLMLDAGADPTDVALANGYYDQAHFIRDFRRRVGQSPQRYLKAAREKTHFYNTSLEKDGILRAPIH